MRSRAPSASIRKRSPGTAARTCATRLTPSAGVEAARGRYLELVRGVRTRAVRPRTGQCVDGRVGATSHGLRRLQHQAPGGEYELGGQDCTLRSAAQASPMLWKTCEGATAGCLSQISSEPADALVTEAQRRCVTHVDAQVGCADPTWAASDAARGVVQGPSKSNRSPRAGPRTKRDDPARPPAAGDEQSNRRIDRNRPRRLDLQMSRSSPRASAKNSIASSLARAVFGQLGRHASARLQQGHGRPKAWPRRAGPPGSGLRWGTTSPALRGHSGTGGGAGLALGR